MPDRQSPTARQVADRIRAQITPRHLPPGFRLPPEQALAAHQRSSRATVRRALHLLLDEAIVLTVPGRGTYIATPVGELHDQLRYTASTIDDLALDRLYAQLASLAAEVRTLRSNSE